VRFYRASKGSSRTFDPLDSKPSIQGPLGWRFNDTDTEILYTAERESLAILEVVLRPGWDKVTHIVVATIEIPNALVVDPHVLNIVLPMNWNARPATDDSRGIAREFLEAIAALPPAQPKPIGLRVPSVASATDFNVLIDPSRKAECTVVGMTKMPFKTLASTAT
jgi:RES domain-containing protein